MDHLQIPGAAIGLLLGSLAYGQQSSIYQIDPTASDVHWRVYKAGAFARLGHNHVVSVAAIRGRIELGDALADSQWELEFDVADLVVDDPELRTRYGEDFASEPSADDIEGTRGNMLGEQVLNEAQFESIALRGLSVAGPAESATLRVAINLLGHTVELDLPAKIEISPGAVTVAGAFSLQHADLGMKPFSVMMGALQVGPQLDFSYSLHATAVGR